MKRLALSGFFFSVLLLASFYAYYADAKKWLDTPFVLTAEQPQCFMLKRGMSLSAFAHVLEDADILGDNKRSWLAWAKHKKLATKVKAGEYCVEAGDTPISFLDKMVQGKTVQYSVAFIEGYNYRQILATLKKNAHIGHELPDNMSAEELAKNLQLKEDHAEGLFATDTFFFDKGMTDKQILLRAYKVQQERLQKEWKNRAKDLPYKTPYEALIMASIIEKETGAAHERPEIAGVFVRRLKKPMRLQTDPTIIYGMGERYKGNIRYKDLRAYTPYNTYVIDGLPPTPIAMPSYAAIKAALHPKDGTALYFVAKGDGTHKFSSSLREHEQAVRAYQLQRKANYRSSVN